MTRVALVGGGTIGIGWATVFTRAGFDVALHDPDSSRLDVARAELDDRLRRLREGGLLDEPVEQVAARLTVHPALDTALAGAGHVQECAPESVDLKRKVFAELDRVAAPDATLASSSSFLTASSFASELEGRARCLVAHPINPPYILPTVELVPAPFTSSDAVERAAALFRAAGMSPVRVEREVEGFVFNRLQGAVLREAYCLVRDGVVSVADLDRLVVESLGRRWSIAGAFETSDLNTRGGLEAHAARMGGSYARMGAERGQDDPWTPDLVRRVADDLHETLPLETWEERVAARDQALIVLEGVWRREPDLPRGGAPRAGS